MEIKRGEEITIEIEDFAYGGKGITKLLIDERPYVIFTLNGIPGQKVKARVVKKKKSFAECRIIEVIEHSEFEIKSMLPTNFWSTIHLITNRKATSI